MNLNQIITLQELTILEFERLRKDGKLPDGLINMAYVQLLASRYALAGYLCKLEHPELFKGKRTEKDRRKYMKKYMQEYLPKYRKNKKGGNNG